MRTMARSLGRVQMARLAWQHRQTAASWARQLVHAGSTLTDRGPGAAVAELVDKAKITWEHGDDAAGLVVDRSGTRPVVRGRSRTFDDAERAANTIGSRGEPAIVDVQVARRSRGRRRS